ncbi:PREDICTED: translation initiation factor IF-2-like, partial [Chinchilla lanigera]|uniref:translation initiation factor IF-2-like n=1 Tax=Chinchilla lanigera TaxID=34839 RepID=UPI0006986C5F
RGGGGAGPAGPRGAPPCAPRPAACSALGPPCPLRPGPRARRGRLREGPSRPGTPPHSAIVGSQSPLCARIPSAALRVPGRGCGPRRERFARVSPVLSGGAAVVQTGEAVSTRCSSRFVRSGSAPRCPGGLGERRPACEAVPRGAGAGVGKFGDQCVRNSEQVSRGCSTASFKSVYASPSPCLMRAQSQWRGSAFHGDLAGALFRAGVGKSPEEPAPGLEALTWKRQCECSDILKSGS